MPAAMLPAEFWSSDRLSFGPVTCFGPVTPDRRTESDAYEPTVHMHRCAQKDREY